MGIPGLLQFIGSASEETCMSRFRGQRIGVDASGWMHRSLSTCARELALGQTTDKHVNYCLSLVHMLRRNGVEPLMVFDGAPVAQKALTNALRMDVRKTARAAVDARRAAGEDDAEDDERLCRKSIGVPPEMVQQLIAALRAERVEFIVAPYEADAQLAYLCKTGQVFAVLTEDSDLLAFGAPRVLFKLQADGRVQMVTLDDLACAEDTRHGGHLFAGQRQGEWEEWRGGLFLDLCILAGCDYLPSLPGVGVRTAHTALRAHRAVEPAVQQILGSGPIAQDYLRRFDVARQIFRHQLVWNGRGLAPLCPLPAGVSVDDLPHIGLMLPDSLARSVCEDASVNASTLEPAAAFPVPSRSGGGAGKAGRAPPPQALSGGVKAEPGARTVKAEAGAEASGGRAMRGVMGIAVKRERSPSPPPTRQAQAGGSGQDGEPPTCSRFFQPAARPPVASASAGAAADEAQPQPQPQPRPQPQQQQQLCKQEEEAQPDAEPLGDAACARARAEQVRADAPACGRAAHVKAEEGEGRGAVPQPPPPQARRLGVAGPLSTAQPRATVSVRDSAAPEIPPLTWGGGGARLGLAPSSPPVVDRAVLACIDRLCPNSASPLAHRSPRTALGLALERAGAAD